MESETEAVKIMTIAELLQRSQPLTATVSLHFPSNPSISHTSSVSSSSVQNPTSSTHPLPHSRTLTPLNHPTIIIGTLTLPCLDGSSSLSCSYKSCFQFSDGSSTVCCDILDFDVSIIGKKIHVFAWNFISLKRGVGFLEIINWRFPYSSGGLRNGLGRSNDLDSFPLVTCNLSAQEDTSRARHRVYGVVESVGPVSVVPCTFGASARDLKSNGGCNLGSSSNLQGFLAQIMVCECRSCSSAVVKSSSVENEDCHSFTKLEIVYFCGSAWSWHSVIVKLIGNCIMLSGLKKKMAFIGTEESRVMYLTTDNSVMHPCRLFKKWLPSSKIDVKGKGECSAYTGIIRGIHMQGMVVELDLDVWLLLTDQKLNLSHGLRVGAIISVRNVHFVNPKFSWTKILILGTCVKTSIRVKSFSPLETVCHEVLQSRSRLGKFIQSLPFSARLWMLLLVSSLSKKFAGFLSDKEILGSNHNEGLAQMYASSQLPMSVFQTQRGAFVGLCRHDSSYGHGREPPSGLLKLVIPISTFISHYSLTFMRMLKLENDCKRLPDDNCLRILSGEARSYSPSIRRIIPSEDAGIVLLGSLKIIPSTGRLEFVDATGSINVLIPDLPSTWDPNKLYEVLDYNVVVDGRPDIVDHLELLDSELISCRNLFNGAHVARELNILIYVHFLWKNVKCRNFPLYPCLSHKNDPENLEPGTYHLLRVSHKFPLLQKFPNNPKISSKSSNFVEAMLLPWNLFLTREGGNLHISKVLRGQSKEILEYCIIDNCEEHVSNKRQKLVKESTSSFLKDGLGNSIHELNACSNSFSKSKEHNERVNLGCSREISCLATLRNNKNEIMVGSAILSCVSTAADMNVNSKLTARKILLEFLSESISKYQLLQIGGYYIIKHHSKDCFCTLKDFHCGGTVKVLVDSGKHLWSLSCVSDGVLMCESSLKYAQDNSASCIDGVFPKDQIEQLPLRSNDFLGVCSDVCLNLPAHLTGLLEDSIQESKENKIQSSTIPAGSANISLSTNSVTGFNVFSGSLGSGCLFPEGNLISVQGNVVDIQDVASNFSNTCLSCASLDALKLKGLEGVTISFCILVLVNHHIVKIFGSASKYAFPIGFGPGVNATFHRVLDARGQNKLILLPVSFIVINSMGKYDRPYSGMPSNRWPAINANTSLDSVSSGLISDFNQSLSQKQMLLRCRVVAVSVLVLESKTNKRDAQSRYNARELLFDIPLAGLVLDDGSSTCCCWANAERAAMLLRLHEKLPERAFERSDWSLKWVGVHDNAPSAASYHLWRILKNYKRITVKNYGSVIDWPSQDLVIVTSDKALCSSDENLLKFIIFNACFGKIWNVVASAVDADDMRRLENEYLLEMENIHGMSHVWAKEISCISHLTEARNMMQELLTS